MKLCSQNLLLGTLTSVVAMLGTWSASANDGATSVIKDRTIGYVMTENHRAMYTTEKMTECPNGTNDGPREQYAKLYPKNSNKRTVAESDLVYEMDVWFPGSQPIFDNLPYLEPVSKIAPGLNLDGKVGPNDFESPDGEKGVDNQLYRVLGCVADHRPGGSLYFFDNNYMRSHEYTRTLIELTNVDSLVNDDDVTVSIYRGLDRLLTDATGNPNLPYSTQRIDERWGKKFMQTMHGKIVNGVLTTAPADITKPYNYAFSDRGYYLMRGAQFRLNVTEEGAKGLFAGYLDIQSWYRALNGALGTHSLSYGKESSPSIYRALYRHADGYPDPETGKNTAISAVEEIIFKQTFIKHKSAKIASDDAAVRTTAQIEKVAP